MPTNKANILIVDDNSDNLKVLTGILKSLGYGVRATPSGAKALAAVELRPPDLILLDVRMPGMNGYEVCDLLKANDSTRNIPVIFISALDDIADKLKGFQVGGVDYITKPFYKEEVAARVEAHVQLLQQRALLKKEIEEKQKANEALEAFASAVAHDIKSFACGIDIAVKDLINKNSTYLELDRSKIISKGCDRILNLVDFLINRQKKFASMSLESAPLSELFQDLTTYWQAKYKEKNGQLSFKEIPEGLNVIAQYCFLRSVFDNLLSNALNHNPPGIEVVVEAKAIEIDLVYITVIDNGVGMRSTENLFELGIKNVDSDGSNLGLFICRQIIQAHNGEIGVESAVGKGSKFWFTVKKAD